jgi:dTMP kinase
MLKMRIMKRGVFISFEGIECCGKGEQIKRVIKYLEEKNIPYFINREPGGNPHGLIFRAYLKNPTLVAKSINEGFKHLPDYPQIPLVNGEIELRTVNEEILGFIMSRAGNSERNISKALEEGKVVLSDRYFHSTMAYQGYGKYRGEKKYLDLIKTLHELLIFPSGELDRTFYLDITFEEQEKRKALAAGRDPNDILENQKREEFERIIEGYRVMAREDPKVILINGMRSPDEVFSDIIKEIEKML